MLHNYHTVTLTSELNFPDRMNINCKSKCTVHILNTCLCAHLGPFTLVFKKWFKTRAQAGSAYSGITTTGHWQTQRENLNIALRLVNL